MYLGDFYYALYKDIHTPTNLPRESISNIFETEFFESDFWTKDDEKSFVRILEKDGKQIIVPFDLEPIHCCTIYIFI